MIQNQLFLTPITASRNPQGKQKNSPWEFYRPFGPLKYSTIGHINEKSGFVLSGYGVLRLNLRFFWRMSTHPLRFQLQTSDSFRLDHQSAD